MAMHTTAVAMTMYRHHHPSAPTRSYLLVSAILAAVLLLAPPCEGQAVNPGAGAIYFPKSRRALLFGGATRPTYFRTITALDLSKPFSTNSPPFTTLQNTQLPTGTQYLIPWVSSSGSEVALFGGIVSNATSSTSVNVNGVVPANSIFEAQVTGDGAGVENINARVFTYNVQAPCYTLATSVAADAKTYMFGGFSYFTNTETNELRVFDESKSLKNVTVSGTTRPPRRQLGSLARIDARRLLLSGGYQNNTGMSDAWMFDLQTATWSPLASLASVRYNHQTVVVKPAGATKSYVVQIGGDAGRSLFEYSELPENGLSVVSWKTGGSVEGKADLRYMVNQAPLVIGGDQIVMFGVSLDPQQFDRFASVMVIKVKEQASGSLAFEWIDNFIPTAAEETKPTTGGSSTGDEGGSGGGGGGGSSATMTLVGILVGMAVIGVAFAGFVWFRRSKRNQAASHKPLNANNNTSTAPPGPPSTVSLQQQPQQPPATMFAPAPHAQQQFQQQPVQQALQPPQLQPYQQPPMDPSRVSYMSSSQAHTQSYADPRLSYMSPQPPQPMLYPQSPPPAAPGTSYVSTPASTGPAPYPATQMPLATPYHGLPQSSTPAFPVSGIAPPMGPPAKVDAHDKTASWYGGPPPPQQQVSMMPQVQTVPSAPPAPAAAAGGGGILTSMPMPHAPGQTQQVGEQEEEVLYLGSQPAAPPGQQPGRP